MMPGEEINATVRREQHRVVVSIAETDRTKAGIAELICELDAGSVSLEVPPSSFVSRLATEPVCLVDRGWEEEQKKELEHARELYREKRGYARLLELEEARQGISFPTAKRLELDKCKKELNNLKAKIRDLTSLLTDDKRPYATA